MHKGESLLLQTRENQSVKKLKQFKEREQHNRKDYLIGSSSEEEHRTNALASGADEGRDKLR